MLRGFLRTVAPSAAGLAAPARLASSYFMVTGSRLQSTAATAAAATAAAATAAAATAAAATATPAAKPVGADAKRTGLSDFLKTRQWSSQPCGDHVTVHYDSGIFAWIVMDRSGSSANALGDSFMASLKAAFDEVDAAVKSGKARVAIVASAKDTFCVGADLEQLYPVTDKAVAEKASRLGQELFSRIERTPYPVVAAVNGQALGGGCELALACHHRVIAASKGVMGLPETLLGLLPGAGGTVRLQRLTGIQTALTWILTGSANKAEKCKKAGAVDAVIESDDRFKGEYRFLEGARSWAGKLVDKPLRPGKGKAKSLLNRLLENNSLGRRVILKKSLDMLDQKTKGKYLGQYLALESVMYAAGHSADAAYKKEAQLFADLMVTPEAKNQCSIHFLMDGMKKLEKKTGLTKDKIPEVKTTGVIGAGVMGSGIVHYFANKGYPCAVKDISEEKVQAGIALVKAEFEAARKKKKLTDADMAKKMKLVTSGTTNDCFKGCDVIVEAAVEKMELKKKLLVELEAQGILTGKNIFATNTSSLSLTDLQSVSKFPSQVVGMHFFNPVSKMPLVEVIKGKQTSPEAVAAIYNVALKTGKHPIIVGDAPGFLVNRILGVYMAEAGRLSINDKADPQRVDQVIKGFGMPMGPFRLLDEVGLDVACHVGPVLENGLKSKRFAVSKQIEQMVADGFLGKKNRKGIYRYDDRLKELGMDVTVASKYLCSAPNTTFSANDILDRCVLLMVNEASLILSEGVCASPEDVDMGMIFGTGFPPFRGGLLQYADHRGVGAIVDRLSQLRDTCKDERFAPSSMLTDMAKGNKRFFPNRPFVPYVERTGSPKLGNVF